MLVCYNKGTEFLMYVFTLFQTNKSTNQKQVGEIINYAKSKNSKKA